MSFTREKRPKISRRFFVDAPLFAENRIVLPLERAHYVKNVLRLSAGDVLHVFNGADGEWRAEIKTLPKGVALSVLERSCAQPLSNDLWYAFAPLKTARLDYVVQKAVEMGASRLAPIRTRRTNVAHVNAARMRANVIEAMEQCGVLTLPEICPYVDLETFLRDWPQERVLLFCDETEPPRSPILALETIRRDAPFGTLIGPEGGFDDGERQWLRSLPQTLPISLGRRVVRADTAAVAAMALVEWFRLS